MSSSAEPVVLAVRLLAKPGSEAQMRRVLLALAEHSRAEDGCVSYMPYADPADARAFLLVEHWADEPALDRHRATPEFQRLAGHELKVALERSEPLRLVPLEARAGQGR